MSNLKKLKAEIIKRVPEIRELKFGCEVKYRCNGDVEYYYNSHNTKAKDDYAKERVKITETEKVWYITTIKDIEDRRGEKMFNFMGVFYLKDNKYYLKHIYSDGTTLIKYLDFEIIGRPINLEDIIIALAQIADNYKGKEYPDGSYWLGAMILKLISNYKLGQPLDNQSEDTINFLTSIICKNN